MDDVLGQIINAYLLPLRYIQSHKNRLHLIDNVIKLLSVAADEITRLKEQSAQLQVEKSRLFRESRFDIIQHLKSSTPCPTCNGSTLNSPMCVFLPCTHVHMCLECWSRWSMVPSKEANKPCPVCREPILDVVLLGEVS